MSQASTDRITADHSPAAAADSLLTTKLFLPPTRSRLVGRPRLTERLTAGLDRELILVSAPAGYGKTTLVSTWLRETGVASSWLSLDDEDNEPRRFLQYLVAAIRKMVPSVPGDAVRMLSGANPAPVEALLTIVINEIAMQSTPRVLVMDDLHVIHAQAVLDIIYFLLEHIPPGLHLVLLSRSDLPLPLAKMRARGQILDLRAGELRFDGHEVAAFLKDVMGLKLSPDDVASIEGRTEGWIAGLQLAALSLQGNRDAHTFVEEFSSRPDYMVDYLVQEVLVAQPESIRTFLLQTSGLQRMSGALCDAVLEPTSEERPTGKAMLEVLDQKNLFVTALDDERQWYRYHHLFADVLHQHLKHVDPELAVRLDARAAAWYEAHGYVPDAIHHCIRSGNPKNAVRLIADNGCSLLISGGVLTLGNWLDAVEGSARDEPWLPIYRGWIAALTGGADRAEEFLRHAEELISVQPERSDTANMRGTIAAARAQAANVQGQTVAAAESARLALTHLEGQAPTSCSLRVVAISLLGDASTISGDLDVAWEAYNEASRAIRSAGDTHLSIVVNSNLANILSEQGQLRRAAAIHRETLEMAALPGGGISWIGGRACVELAQICYEWNRLEETAEHIERGLALCRPWGNRDMVAIALAMKARVSTIQGKRDEARQEAEEANEMVRDYRLTPAHVSWIKSALARVWLAQGEVNKVAGLVADQHLMDVAEVPYPRELDVITLARLRLAEGDPGAALQWVRRILPRADASGQNNRAIELRVLTSLALQAQGEVDGALECLGQALAVAAPEGYVRSFLDEGESMARLLYLARGRGPAGGYATELLDAARSGGPGGKSPAQLLVEPLTRRELEVLRRIDRGCSNHEIASDLYISPATVKRHISNIYAKLDADSRTLALRRARDLHLLD